MTFPGSLDIRAGGADDQHDSTAPDFGVPRDDEQVVSAIVEAVGRARHRQDVLVGCRGGIGRTGTL